MTDYKKELETLRGYITQTIPYLEEAWRACFHGEPEALLSAEERGMGFLLSQFRQIADGHYPLPAGCITIEEENKNILSATQWAYNLLGTPNDLPQEIQEWMIPGETCADGLRRAHYRVLELESLLSVYQEV